ncbi:uncharacterized protein LOC143909979 [Arctopsyche grandis]|uniref:uncharacterized protein LOC143909979 n=1 Tax=Arctopsyche grandis TaxID=121162 RepID=UPI00406D67DE
MGHSRLRWTTLVTSILFTCLLTPARAVVTSGASDKVSVDGPPGLIDIQSAEDLVAEASIDTQKREIPGGGLSNSYGEPIPADSYGPPQEDNGHVLAPQPIPISDSYGPPSKPDLGLPIPVYGVPDDPSNHIKYPELPPDIPPPISIGGPPHQTYGPPQLPHDIYGPPKGGIGHNHHSIHKINGGGSQYHGPPPPPLFGPPKLQYGPPKALYGPPKPQYGPPKYQHGPPKPIYGLPKPQYGPPKLQYIPPKPQYGPPKPHYGPPKLQYGPPKPIYGPPKIQYGPPKPQYGPPKPIFLQKPHPIYGPPISHIETNQVLKPLFPIPEDTYGPPGKPIGSDYFSHQLISSDQAYGPPIGIHHGPPQPDPNPRPAHPGIPAPPTPPHILYDGWTPIPGLVSKPHNGHFSGGLQDNYGPPPPPSPIIESDIISSSFHSSGNIDAGLHSGISSGVSLGSFGGTSGSFGATSGSFGATSGSFGAQSGSFGAHSGSFGAPSGSYGTPIQSVDIHSIGGSSDHSHSSNSFISSGYSSVSGNEGLQGIDLNSIIGSSHSDGGIGLQGSKTVFEAHYTEGGNSHGSIDSSSHSLSDNFDKHVDSSGGSVSVLQSLGFDLGSNVGFNSQSHSNSISSSYGVPLDSFSANGPYPGPRQLSGSHSFSSDIGLKPPSGIYGVPPGGKYGIPPPPPPHNTYKPSHQHNHLALSYGVPSGSIGSGSIHALGASSPKRPINFRDPVPSGLLENIGHTVIQKDVLGIDDSNIQTQHTYLPPPVQALPETSHSSSFSIQASIEPSNLYSLPSATNPINFQNHGSQQISSSGYSSSLDSYNAPFATVSDSYGAPSIENSVTTTLDGKNIVKTENSETNSAQADAASLAAAILKNCPYHKALYEAAKNVEQQNPSVLASSLIASLNSDSSDSSNSASSITNAFKQLPPGTNLINFNENSVNSNSQSSQHNSLLSLEESKSENQKGKSLNTGEQAANFQQSNQNSFQQSQSILLNNIPIQGNLGAYTLQIQSANGLGQSASPDAIPHEQVLSEGLLQSILQAIEQPHQTQIIPQETPTVELPQNNYFDLSQAQSGLVLPEGYEFSDNIKNNKNDNIKRGDQNAEDEDSSQEGSEGAPVIIVAPQNSKINSKSFLEQFGISSNENERAPEIVTPLNIIDDNEIAVYFNSKDDSTETVTEISIETSIKYLIYTSINVNIRISYLKASCLHLQQ